MLHIVRGVQAPGTHVRSDYPQTRHIGGRSSSHKATLIPQNKRQDTITTMIPCLCSFTVPSSPSAEPPINKKRTRTLFHKELGSSTNCMVDGTGLEQGGSDDASRQSKQSAQLGCCLARGSRTCRNVYQESTACRSIFPASTSPRDNNSKRQGITIELHPIC